MCWIHVENFETKFSEYVGCKNSVAVSSATSALHLAMMSINLGSNDIVWTSPNSFVASSNCALYCGAKVEFIDIDPHTFNIDIELLESKLKIAKEKNTLPKALIPVHFAGLSCDMRSIKKLSDTYGFKIIEDAAHATGATYDNNKVGSCQYSDIAVFSFHPVKIITTAEGGMISTNDEKIAKKAKLLRSHGITKSIDDFMDKTSGEIPWYYEQVELGYNYRMTDIQAALGISQLDKINLFVEKRKAIANQYIEQLSSYPLDFQLQNDESESSWHLFVARIKSTGDSNRVALFNHLKSLEINCQVHYIPIPLQPYYRSIGYDPVDYPNSMDYYDECISFPIYPSLSDDQFNLIISSIKGFFSNNESNK